MRQFSIANLRATFHATLAVAALLAWLAGIQLLFLTVVVGRSERSDGILRWRTVSRTGSIKVIHYDPARLGLTIAAGAALSAICWSILWWWIKQGRKAPEGRWCARCGYDLRGTPTALTCPECGEITLSAGK